MGGTELGIWASSVDTGFAPEAIDFGARTDAFYTTKTSNFSNNATDIKIGTFSCWVDPKTSIGAFLVILSSSDTHFATKLSNGIVAMIRVSPGQDLFNFTAGEATFNCIQFESSPGSILTAGGWYHIACCWDSADASKCHIMINGVEDTNIDFRDNVNADWTRTEWHVGITKDAVDFPVSPNLGHPMDGCISELYLSREFTDVSIPGQLQRFRTSGGEPVDLGATGANVTGTPPVIYLKSNAAGYLTNSSGNGNFDTITGSLSDCPGP